MNNCNQKPGAEGYGSGTLVTSPHLLIFPDNREGITSKFPANRENNRGESTVLVAAGWQHLDSMTTLKICRRIRNRERTGRNRDGTGKHKNRCDPRHPRLAGAGAGARRRDRG